MKQITSNDLYFSNEGWGGLQTCGWGIMGMAAGAGIIAGRLDLQHEELMMIILKFELF